MAEREKHARPYLYEGDLLRLLLIIGVVLTHTETTLTNATATGSVSHLIFNSTHTMLHFTRMGFVFVTGLVLTWQYFDRHPNWITFWYRRYVRIGIPYLVWNTVLLAGLLAIHQRLTWTRYAQRWLTTIGHGNQFYMYFLFMIAQLYLIFPILLWIVEKTRDHHQWLIGFSFGLQLLLTAVIKYGHPTTAAHPVLGIIFHHYGTDPLMYQLYFVMGAVTAVHYQRVSHWLKVHLKVLSWLAVGLSVATIGLYWVNINVLGFANHDAQSIHQPFVVLLDVVTIMALLGVSQWGLRRSWVTIPVVHRLGQLTFGIYLTQSIFLTALAGLLRLTAWPSWVYLVIVPLCFVAVFGTILIWSYGLSRLKWTRSIIGLKLDSENKMIKSY